MRLLDADGDRSDRFAEHQDDQQPQPLGQVLKMQGSPAERSVATTGAVTSVATATTQAAYRAGPDTIAPANHNPAAVSKRLA